VPVIRRVHRPTRSAYESFLIEGLPVLEHVVGSHSELVGDDTLGPLGSVPALELFVASVDGRGILLCAQDDLLERPLQIWVANLMVAAMGWLAV